MLVPECVASAFAIEHSAGPSVAVLSQRGGADADDVTLEVGEPLGSEQEFARHQKGPPFADDVERVGGRAAVVVGRTGLDVLASAANEYDMHTGPFGTIRAAERYRFRDGRIVFDQLVFDASALKADPVA